MFGTDLYRTINPEDAYLTRNDDGDLVLRRVVSGVRMYDPCGKCDSCKRKWAGMCEKVGGLGYLPREVIPRRELEHRPLSIYKLDEAIGLANAAMVEAGLIDEFGEPIETDDGNRKDAIEYIEKNVPNEFDSILETREEWEAFAVELERQPDGFEELPGLLSKLEGRNVVVVYIESYGMAALEDSEFAATIQPRLDTAAARLTRAGLKLVTGELVSPTLGGQSWYAHGTMLSGLWLENQLRYDLLIASERETMVDDFRAAGYRTATVMPAITTSWPEATRLGYDDVYTMPTIPYAGPPLYWVTMPDQFTWSFLGQVIQEATTPLFVEVGMVSSHAPWTPVLPLLDWDSVGDGTIFEPHRQAGHPPEELWWDTQILREGYARSLDYSLQVMTEFAERFLDDRTLLVVVGDHQAAPWVTGASSPNVPVHVIAHDSTLIEPFVEWGFRPGAFPDPEGSPPRMDEFRDWFIRGFSGDTSQGGASGAPPG